ncbi:MAG: hypothetical protein J6X03_06075, partial [Bacilli bacterium]|nr:hypothetical protein [Bacilli bacterium]
KIHHQNNKKIIPKCQKCVNLHIFGTWGLFFYCFDYVWRIFRRQGLCHARLIFVIIHLTLINKKLREII